jgi:hypothetical protein
MTQTQRHVVETLPQEIRLAAATASHSLLYGFSAIELEQNLATLRCFVPSHEAAQRLKDIYYVRDPIRSLLTGDSMSP